MNSSKAGGPFVSLLKLVPESGLKVETGGSFSAVLRQTEDGFQMVLLKEGFAAMHGKTWDRAKHVTQRGNVPT